MSEDQFKKAYDALLPYLEQAKTEVARLLTESITQLGNPHLVRGTLEASRVKTFHSVLRKCKRKKLLPSQIQILSDLVGLRVVCANLEDVSRLVQLVKSTSGLSVSTVSNKKTADGYRAVHVDLQFSVQYASMKRRFVPCELQIRTFLQDSWARQTHRDLYKGSRVSPRIRQLSRHLSDLLKTADGLAQQIREEVSQRRSPSGAIPGAVTKEGLALIYQRAFSEPAADYILQTALRSCEQEGLDRLDALDRLLSDKAVRQRLMNAYRRASGHPVAGYAADVAFQFAPLAVTRGISAAVAALRVRAKADDADMEGVFRREILGSLPMVFEDFMEAFRAVEKDDDPASDIRMYAAAFGCHSSCGGCGTLLVDEYDFAAAIQRHYAVDDREDEILAAIWGSGVETGVGSCSSCSNALGKD